MARPSDVAERLPKVLIHRNVPGEPIHELLQAADRAWDRAAGWAPHGPRVRWRMAQALLADAPFKIKAHQVQVRLLRRVNPGLVWAVESHGGIGKRSALLRFSGWC